jgi:hypothetical protein
LFPLVSHEGGTQLRLGQGQKRRSSAPRDVSNLKERDKASYLNVSCTTSSFDQGMWEGGTWKGAGPTQGPVSEGARGTPANNEDGSNQTAAAVPLVLAPFSIHDRDTALSLLDPGGGLADSVGWVPRWDAVPITAVVE